MVFQKERLAGLVFEHGNSCLRIRKFYHIFEQFYFERKAFGGLMKVVVTLLFMIAIF